MWRTARQSVHYWVIVLPAERRVLVTPILTSSKRILQHLGIGTQSQTYYLASLFSWSNAAEAIQPRRVRIERASNNRPFSYSVLRPVHSE